MKKPLLVAATVAMLFTGAAASAQPYGGPYGDRDRDGRPNYRDRHDNRRDYHGHRRWERGQRYDHYRSREYMVRDYRSHGWRAPPRGYAYYRTDSGDVVLAAIATGIITSVILSDRY